MNDTPNPVTYPTSHDIWQLIARDTINGWDDVNVAFDRAKMKALFRGNAIAAAHWKEAQKKAAVAVCRACIALGVPTPVTAHQEANL